MLNSCAVQQCVTSCQLQAVFAAAHGPVQASPPQQPHGSPHSPERAAHSAVWDQPNCGSCGGGWLRGAAAAGSQGRAISRSAHACIRLGCCRWCLQRFKHMLTAQMCTQVCVHFDVRQALLRQTANKVMHLLELQLPHLKKDVAGHSNHKENRFV